MVAVVVLAGGGPVSAAGEDADAQTARTARTTQPARTVETARTAPAVLVAPERGEATVRGADGVTHIIGRMSAAQLAAHGLTGYVPAGYVRTGAVTGPDTTVAPSPRRRGAGGGGVHPAACWYHEFQYGSALWGKGSEYWCGDGNWITYRSSDCWGGSDWSNYRYGGCSRWDDYGAGWNVSDLTVQWAFCYSWFGYCANGWSYPWEKYRYSAWGAVYWLGGW